MKLVLVCQNHTKCCTNCWAFFFFVVVVFFIRFFLLLLFVIVWGSQGGFKPLHNPLASTYFWTLMVALKYACYGLVWLICVCRWLCCLQNCERGFFTCNLATCVSNWCGRTLDVWFVPRWPFADDETSQSRPIPLHVSPGVILCGWQGSKHQLTK